MNTDKSKPLIRQYPTRQELFDALPKGVDLHAYDMRRENSMDELIEDHEQWFGKVGFVWQWNDLVFVGEADNEKSES